MERNRSWVEMAEDRLRENFGTLRHRAGDGIEVMAVVKANAYGHGAERCAVELARAGARWFGVGDVQEGARVRGALDSAGYGDAEILVVCGPLPEDTTALRESRLTPVIWTAQQASSLAGGMSVHVELETGMGRQGCRPGAGLDALLDAMETAGLRLGGVMTHFCQPEVVNSPKTREQQAGFERGLKQILQRGLRPEWVHAGSSSTLDNPSWDRDAAWLRALASEVGAQPMVRCGIGLYGYCNPLCGGESVLRPQLRPVMRWMTRVLDVRDLAAGESVGYNSTFTASTPMHVALLPVGYADGLRRSMSSTDTHAGGWVMISGRRAPILGRVSMNLTIVDVGGTEAIAPGDEVVVLGDGVTADDHARLAGTIAYEILCGVREAPRAGFAP